MTGDTLFVFAVLAATVIAFASDRVRLDLVAMLAVLALTLGGVLTPAEAFAGFGDTLVILIAALFLVGEGLAQTGVAGGLARRLTGLAGTHETRLVVLLMVVVAVLSAFMSSTGAVAIFIPVVLGIAARLGLPPGRLLMPLSIAALVGGMLTLIGTPPNLVVAEQLRREGLPPFAFFDFTPIGLLILAVAIAYVVVVGRRLLPGGGTVAAEAPAAPSVRDLADAYGIRGEVCLLQAPAGAAFVGRTIAETRLRSRYGVTALGIERGGRLLSEIMPALIDTRIETEDRLYVVGEAAAIDRVAADTGVAVLPLPPHFERNLGERIGFVELLLPPRSDLIGRTLRETRLRETRRLSVIGVQRQARALPLDAHRTRFAFGDTLLAFAGREEIEGLARSWADILPFRTPREQTDLPLAGSRAPLALGIVAVMLVVMTLGLAPTVVAAVAAAIAMLVTGCVRPRDTYRAIHWQSLVLIAGMLPMATAMANTGGVALLADGLVGLLGPAGPIALMAGLFVLTSVLSQFISNTATTVLLAPVAIGAASAMGVSPYPVLMTVALAASTAFSTPVASPVNTLVLGPGQYRFVDFARVGVPLQIVCLGLTLLAAPLVFPL